jgi:signal transduction histidine kinase/CheY-like chemotaxis protein/putative methionine-R-sulfoxide reductase with GAF domain
MARTLRGDPAVNALDRPLSPSVLLVDDTPANLVVLEAVLDPLGVRLVHAASGAEALACVARESFAAVLLDVQMPEMDGFQVARRLRETAPGREPPIIFLTAVYRDEDFSRRGYAEGAADYITKPFDANILRARVKAFVDLYRQREAVRGFDVRERTRERDDAVRRLMALERISTLALETDDLPTLLRELLLVFLGAADAADAATIHLREGERLRVAASVGAADEPMSVPFAKGFAGTIASTGRPLHTPLGTASANGAASARPSFGVPLVANGEVVGVASMSSGSAAEFSEAERKVFLAMAERAAWAVSKHQERDHLQRVLANAPAMIAMYKGADHTCTFANVAAREGRLDVEVAGKRAVDLGTSTEALRLMDRVFETGEPQNVDEFRVLGSDGVAERFLRLTLQATRSASGSIDGVLVFAIDVTPEVRSRRELELYAKERARLLENERAARDAAESANRAKDEFLATVSHELRTPLNAILGWTVIARRQAAGTEVDRALSTIERNAHAQTRIIDDVVDISRMTSGRLRVEIESTEVAKAVEGAVQAVRPAADARGVRLDVTIDEAIGSIAADADRLQQIVWNILSNAIKFTPRGGHVELSATRVEHGVRIRIRDDGQGIRPEFLAHLFEPFRQQEGGTTRRHGGLGLGLAIVQRLVQAHGGTIRAESEGEGMGAVFTVDLPSLPSPQPAKRPFGEGVDPAPNSSRLEGLTLLVVDDDQDGRELLARVLGDQGAVVLSASSAQAAIRVLEEFRPDVLLSDVAMPEMDGYGLIRRIRRLPASRGGRTRAIALTAYARPEDAEQAMSAGFQAHVSKPVHPGRLIAMIAELASGGSVPAPALVQKRIGANRSERPRK